MVIIGVDPHPDSHTAAALDENGKILDHCTIPTSTKGIQRLRTWAQRYPQRQWAIEGANNSFVTPLSHELANHEVVVDIPPSLTSQYRSKRGQSKSDSIDAEIAARVLLANAELPRFKPQPITEQLKTLVRTRERLVQQRHANQLALRHLSEGEVGHDVLTDLVAQLRAHLKRLEAQLRVLVERLMPELLKVRGVGVVVAATLLAEVGDISRFRSQHAFASYCGCAPVERSSGRNRRSQVNAGGNRRLNRVLYLMAMVRLRTEERSRELVARKEREGKTLRAAIRVLKTYLAREVFRVMMGTAVSRVPVLGPCS